MPSKIWLEQNREKWNAYIRQRNQTNPQSRAQAEKAWRARNPDKVRQIKLNGRHIRRTAEKEGDYITVQELSVRDNDICGICGNVVAEGDRSIDHKVALSIGGSHTWNNVQLAHRTCNSSKGIKVA